MHEGIFDMTKQKENKGIWVETLPDGTKYYRNNEKLHRTDGPAIEYANGDKCWFVNGMCHNTEGPAVEYTANGTELKAYYLEDKKYLYEEWLRMRKLIILK